MYGPDHIRSGSNELRPAKPTSDMSISRLSCHVPVSHWCRLTHLSGARETPDHGLSNRQRSIETLRKKAFWIPAIFGAFFGDSDHCFWQMWYENQPSCWALCVFILRFNIWSIFEEVKIWKCMCFNVGELYMHFFFG
jgi:hypothetical protein